MSLTPSAEIIVKLLHLGFHQVWEIRTLAVMFAWQEPHHLSCLSSPHLILELQITGLKYQVLLSLPKF